MILVIFLWCICISNHQLNILNVYSDICQLFLSEAGGKEESTAAGEEKTEAQPGVITTTRAQPTAAERLVEGGRKIRGGLSRADLAYEEPVHYNKNKWVGGSCRQETACRKTAKKQEHVWGLPHQQVQNNGTAGQRQLRGGLMRTCFLNTYFPLTQPPRRLCLAEWKWSMNVYQAIK